MTLRDQFLSFFQNHNHIYIPPSPLVPSSEDKSLMFVNSGMVQFKELLLTENLELRYFITNNNIKTNGAINSSSATTCQKCLRAGGKHNDIENVGYTKRHHTFFEMLGNFSFGGYFKEEAIKYAWSLLVSHLCIDPNRLYVTVYYNDNEAYEIWQKYIKDKSRIIKVKTSDNFWSMGDIGPCGPCSEIYYDYGDKEQGIITENGVEGERYVEIWNIVFMEFQKTLEETGNSMVPLERKCIDTGMGLERMLSVIEGKTDNYETSYFSDLINNIAAEYQISSANLSKYKTNLRVIADHIRAMTFMIAGEVDAYQNNGHILPSNVGAGYVLRRIMRRAMRYANEIDSGNCKLPNLVKYIVTSMPSYPELALHQKKIEDCIKTEEEGFKALLNNGMQILNGKISLKSKNKESPEEIAFKMYDTFGFPLDLTLDALRRSGIEINTDGIEALLKEQQNKSRLDREAKMGPNNRAFAIENLSKLTLPLYTLFNRSGHQCSSLADGEKGYINIPEESGFYAAGGGQLGDIGLINSTKLGRTSAVDDYLKFCHNGGKNVELQPNTNTLAIIHNTFKLTNGIWVEVEAIRSLKQEDLKKADFVCNIGRKYGLAIHHTATHILHTALRKVLGEEATQKGSQLYFDKLRFDFSYSKPISPQQLEEVERIANEAIILNIPVCEKGNISKEEAEASGAIALFGEKYGSKVRTICIGLPSGNPFSIELCGGTHVKNTGDIGVIKILSDQGIGSGVRRIEAVAGMIGTKYLLARANQMQTLLVETGVASGDEVTSKVKLFKKQAKEAEENAEAIILHSILNGIKNIKANNGIKELHINVPSIEICTKVLGKVLASQQFKASGCSIVLFVNTYNGKNAEVVLLAAYNQPVDEKVQLIKHIASLCNTTIPNTKSPIVHIQNNTNVQTSLPL